MYFQEQIQPIQPSCVMQISVLSIDGKTVTAKQLQNIREKQEEGKLNYDFNTLVDELEKGNYLFNLCKLFLAHCNMAELADSIDANNANSDKNNNTEQTLSLQS